MPKSGTPINGPALAEIRRARGLTISSAADAAGISPDHWRSIEAARRQASPAVVDSIVNALDVEDVRSILAETIADAADLAALERARRNRRAVDRGAA